MTGVQKSMQHHGVEMTFFSSTLSKQKLGKIVVSIIRCIPLRLVGIFPTPMLPATAAIQALFELVKLCSPIAAAPIFASPQLVCGFESSSFVPSDHVPENR